MLSFQELYESHATEVYRFAFSLAGQRPEAEDITSETFIRAWGRRTAIRTETLRAYLFAIARNVYLEHQRKKRTEVGFEDLHADPAPGADKMVESRQELLAAQKVLQSVPESDRAAFIMRVQHELPYAEIARVLGLSLAATKVKVHRVRKRLIAASCEREIS